MKSEEEIINHVLYVANSDDRVRAVLLTGSRANLSVPKDIFQDFDIIYIVWQMDSFINDKQWIDIFGERLILQLPDEMSMGKEDDHAFHYLMLFKDGNRIDLTLFPLEKFETAFKKDSLTVSLLDKDDLFKNLPPANDTDYHIKRPAEKEFTDCCNEFWWVSTYVAKGLWRKEITYAKEMMEVPVRWMFLKMIEWYIGIKNDFAVTVGKAGRNMKKYISPQLYDKILFTYPDSNIENIWESLFEMTNLFDELASEIAGFLEFHYKKDEACNVKAYLQEVYTNSKERRLT
ncbi:MAG TPA: aminoglycoside 6-adenylyltransferase [Chitinophagaceae bacterium]